MDRIWQDIQASFSKFLSTGNKPHQVLLCECCHPHGDSMSKFHAEHTCSAPRLWTLETVHAKTLPIGQTQDLLFGTNSISCKACGYGRLENGVAGSVS